MSTHVSRAPMSRREVLRLAAAAGIAVPLFQSRRATAGSEAGDVTFFSTQFNNVEEAERVEINLIGGLHGDLAPLAADGLLEDLSDVMEGLADKGYSEDFLELARAGGDSTAYIPWMQATYVVAVHND